VIDIRSYPRNRAPPTPRKLAPKRRDAVVSVGMKTQLWLEEIASHYINHLHFTYSEFMRASIRSFLIFGNVELLPPLVHKVINMPVTHRADPLSFKISQSMDTELYQIEQKLNKRIIGIILTRSIVIRAMVLWYDEQMKDYAPPLNFIGKRSVLLGGRPPNLNL